MNDFSVNNQLMKKLVIFLFIIAITISSLQFPRGQSGIFDVAGVNEVCFVANEKFEGEFETIACGEKFFNFCSFQNAKDNANLIKDSDAVQFYTDQDNIEKLLSDIKFQQLSSEEVEGIQILYGYTPYYNSSILLEGKKVNVQIAMTDEKIVVGFPIILTGY